MQKTEHIITSDGSSTLHSTYFDASYHSLHGAITESNHVFIHNGLDFIHAKKDKIRVFEFGFGTGLNAWLTLSFAERHKKNISYETIELFPLQEAVWKILNYPDQLHFDESEKLFKDLHQSTWNEKHLLSDYFEFKKFHVDWNLYSTNTKFDLIFFDAFSPDTQEELWNLNSLNKIYSLLDHGGVVVSYCAKGSYKRNLKEVGFQVEKLPGPPGKREMTRGIKN